MRWRNHCGSVAVTQIPLPVIICRVGRLVGYLCVKRRYGKRRRIGGKSQIEVGSIYRYLKRVGLVGTLRQSIGYINRVVAACFGNIHGRIYIDIHTVTFPSIAERPGVGIKSNAVAVAEARASKGCNMSRNAHDIYLMVNRLRRTAVVGNRKADGFNAVGIPDDGVGSLPRAGSYGAAVKIPIVSSI